MMFLNKWMNAFHMKNSQQIWKNLMMNKMFIINDIIYLNIYILQNLYTNFLDKRCGDRKNFYTNVYHTKHVKILYKRYSKCWPFETKSHEINRHRKVGFNINGMTIHFTLLIP